MKAKAKIKWTLDVLMTIALFFLMGYQFWGEAVHEWIGAGMFALFIAHQVCNLNWYKNLFRGRYTPIRILQCMINILTLVAMLALMYSGITMSSRHVFAFLPIRGGMALARRLHILGSYWGYVLMSLHLGLHWGMVLNVAAKKYISQRKYQAAGFIIGLLTAAYGVYVFIKRNFLTYMFLRSEFVFLDYEESKMLFFLDYLALMGLCIFMAHYIAKLFRRTGSRRKEGGLALFLCAALIAALTACAGNDEGAAYSGEPAVQSEVDAETSNSETSNSEISETGSRQEPSLSEEDKAAKNAEEAEVSNSNILIAYFTWAENTHVENPEAVDVDATTSASVLPPGNTAKMANWIRERVGGDLFSIVVKEPYSDHYDECLDRAADEKAENARPELANHVENMQEYDVIFLGFPNWWYSAPMAIFTFIEEYDFSGKTIIPFCAHGTGGLASSVKDITDALPDFAEILEPIGVYRPDVDSAQPAINEWLDRLGYTEEKQAETDMENDISATMKAEVESETETTEMKIKITVGDTELTAVMEDNATTRALIEQMPMTLSMMDLYGREMCYRYGAYALPTDELQSDGYEVGDLAYWAPGGSLVILYKQNGEQFERQHLGHIESGVEVFEDTGDVDVTFELMESIQ